jgi:hypothetical protein
MANTQGFIKAVQDNYGMRPVVPFQTALHIGDIGYLGSDGVWNPVSTTRQRFGVAPTGIRKQRDEHGIWTLDSGKNVKFKAYGKGQTSKLVRNVADAKARAEIEFNSARSFVFAARDVTVSSASEMSALIDAIRLAYHNRKDLPEGRAWDARLVFVFAVADAARFVAVLADQKDTAIAVTGSAKVGPPSSPAELTAKVSFGSSSNELQKANLTNARSCLYRAYQLDPSILRRWDKEQPKEVHFAHSSWNYMTGGQGIAGRSPGAVFGSRGFERFGGEGEVGFKVSRAKTPSFERTFREI